MSESLVAFALCPMICSQYGFCLKISLMFGFSCTKLQKINKKMELILPNSQFQCCVRYESTGNLWSDPPPRSAGGGGMDISQVG